MAHSIKGAAANAGAERVKATAFRMEKLAGKGNLAGVGTFFDELNAAFDRFMEAVGHSEI